MITAKLPAVVFKTIALDSTSPLNKLLVYASIVGLKVDASKDPAELRGVTDMDLFTKQTALAIVQAGGDVDNFPWCIKVAEADYESDTPEVLPRSKVTEEDETVRQAKWSEWKDETHEHHLIDGTYWIPGNSVSGIELKGSEVLALIGAGVTVETMKDLQAAMPEPEGE